MKIIIITIVSILFISSFSPHVFAWETLVNEEEGKGSFSWMSLYQKEDANKAAAKRRPKANRSAEDYAEHTRLADMALNKLGVGKTFNRKGSASILLKDLNINLFRYDDLGGLPTFGDLKETEMEERLFVSPAHFSGIPDYSYTIYDWLNKNQYCPPGENAEIQKACHVYFFGWLGNLNSTHFGTQATKMYDHYHTIATFLAYRAQTLNRQSRNAGGQASYEYHKEFIREAELEALAYEGYAQHFLQDRWAIGHMWERWGAGDYDQLPDKGNANNTLVGAVAGMVHGSEAVINKTHNLTEFLRQIKIKFKVSSLLGPAGELIPERIQDNIPEVTIPSSDYFIDREALQLDPSKSINVADPMSSPLIIDENTAKPLMWRHDGHKELIAGIGDDRLSDMKDGLFGKEYLPFKKDFKINVKRQQKEMMNCSMAGWAEVIKEFGKFDGKFGAWEVSLENDPNFKVTKRKSCWDMWATNRSIEIGTTKDQFVSYSILGRLAFGATNEDITDKALKLLLNSTPIGLLNTDFVRLSYNIEMANKKDPNDIDLAKGGIGSLMGTKTGNHYMIPNYTEPLFFEHLSDDIVETGKDKQAIFGAFSRAHSDHWCKNFKNVFKKYDLRGSDDPRKQEICTYLADFVYDQTEPFYKGEQLEKRKDKSDNIILSMCTIRGHTKDGGDNRFPRYLNQGYVPYGNAGHPQDKNKAKTTYQSIENWCHEIPVIQLSEEQDLQDENVIAEFSEDEDYLMLEGYNFGDKKGQVFYYEENSKEVKVFEDIQRWDNSNVELNLRYQRLEAGKTYRLEIETAPDSKGKKKISVGLFKLKIKEAPKVVRKKLDLTGLGPCRTNLDSIKTIDMTKSLPEDPEVITAKYLGELSKAYGEYYQDVAKTIDQQADCMEKLKITSLKQRARIGGGCHSVAEPARDAFFDTYIKITRNAAIHLRQVDWDIKGWKEMLEEKDYFYMPQGIFPFGLVTEANKYKSPLAAHLRSGFNIDTAKIKKHKQAKEFFTKFSMERKKTIGNILNKQFTDLENTLQKTVNGLVRWTQIENNLSTNIVPREIAYIDPRPELNEFGLQRVLYPCSVIYKSTDLASLNSVYNGSQDDFKTFLMLPYKQWFDKLSQSSNKTKDVYTPEIVEIPKIDSPDNGHFQPQKIDIPTMPKIAPMPQFKMEPMP